MVPQSSSNLLVDGTMGKTEEFDAHFTRVALKLQPDTFFLAIPPDLQINLSTPQLVAIHKHVYV